MTMKHFCHSPFQNPIHGISYVEMITHNTATTRNLLLSFAQENYCEKLLSWISLFADHIHYTPKKKPCWAENTQYPPNELLLDVSDQAALVSICSWE